MDHLQTRLEVLEQQVQTLHEQTRTVTRQLRWWRGLACSLIVLALLSWVLPSGTAQEDATSGERWSLAQRLPDLEKLRLLLRHLTITIDEEGHPEVVITGANLRIINGLEATDTTNALGNLMVGYNELRPSGAPNDRSGSHNVIIGRFDNFSSFGGLVVGEINEISGPFASVSGGTGNTASGLSASVCGGLSNTASNEAATVSGGGQNTASGFIASISGGSFNTAPGNGATVSGGEVNTASGFRASVSGGSGNIASGEYSSVSGGRNRTAAGEFDWVAGSLLEDQ